jgi:hypothetical protein
MTSLYMLCVLFILLLSTTYAQDNSTLYLHLPNGTVYGVLESVRLPYYGIVQSDSSFCAHWFATDSNCDNPSVTTQPILAYSTSYTTDLTKYQLINSTATCEVLNLTRTTWCSARSQFPAGQHLYTIQAFVDPRYLYFVYQNATRLPSTPSSTSLVDETWFAPTISVVCIAAVALIGMIAYFVGKSGTPGYKRTQFK